MDTPPPPAASPGPPHPRRRWLRFSLRAGMILVVAVGAIAGWLAHRIRSQREAVAAVHAAGGSVRFDYESRAVRPAPGAVAAPGRAPGPASEPPAPAWLRRWLGDELFRSVETVSFPGSVSGQILATVARFDRLELLHLTELADGGAELRHLRGLDRLTSLRIGGPGATDAALAEIAQIPALRNLLIIKAPATAAGFVRLGAVPTLESLDITNCPNFTDAGGAEMVRGMPRLRALGLDEPAVGATLAALVRHHPDLTGLSLQHSGATDADLASLAGMGQLERLLLQQTAITDAGLVHLRSLQKLTRLDVNVQGVTDEGLNHLAGLTALRELNIGNARVTDAGLVHLVGLPLRRLTVGATLVTDAGMPTIARLTDLEQLSLLMLPALTDAALVPLRSLVNLHQLDVRRTQITPGGVAALRQALPGLTRVQMGLAGNRARVPAGQ